MKFFAILRDSVREAMDAKIIYALFVLSGLVIALAFSISFKAESGEKGLEGIIARMPGASGGFGPRSPLKYTIEDFQQVNEGKPAWQGHYRYNLVVTESDMPGPVPEGDEEGEEKEKDKKAREAKKPAKERPSQFRTLVLLSMVGMDDSELNEEERQTKQRIRDAAGELIRGGMGGQPNPKQAAAMEATLTREIASVGKPQLERFVERGLRASGSLKVTDLKLVSEKDREFRFQVDCEALPDTVRTWPHDMWILFGAVKIPTEVAVGPVIYFIQDYIVYGLGASITMFLGMVITAFFIPNMLRKGSTDLLISKPIHRWWLLVCKYVGGLSFVFINTVVIVVGLWLALGLRSGLWGTGFLLGIFVLTLQFAIFYAVSTLLAVLTRSPIVCILGCALVYLVLWGIPAIGGLVKPFHEMKVTPAWVYDTLDVTRKSLPRYKDLDALNSMLIAGDLLAKDSELRKVREKQANEINWWASMGITFGYIAACLGLACWLFSMKDY